MSGEFWRVIYSPEAKQDLKNLDGSTRIIVRKAIQKVSQNPLPVSEGGFGKPLGNKDNANLTGCLKIKILSTGIRVIYQLKRTELGMEIIVIGARADSEVYKEAIRRMEK